MNDKYYEIKKGGSDTTIILISNTDGKVVRKLSQGSCDKLKFQYDWLRRRHGLKNVTDVISSCSESDLFFYDMPYHQDYIPYFNYISKNPVENSITMLDKIIDFTTQQIHTSKKTQSSEQIYQEYLKVKVKDKMRRCFKLIDDLESLCQSDSVVINDVSYLGFTKIYNKLSSDPGIVKLCSEYKESAVHGDLTVENILVNHSGNFILLDPNNENIISDPLIDWAKLNQSFDSKYEYLCTINECKKQDNVIFHDQIHSQRYEDINNYFNKKMKEKLTDQEILKLKLHQAIHFSRMLPYKARKSPQTFYVFWSSMIKLFHEFLEDYKV